MKYLFVAYIDDGDQNYLPNIWGNGDVAVYIVPKKHLDCDWHFEIDNDKFNDLFQVSSECSWITKKLNLEETKVFLTSIGMIEDESIIDYI